MSETIGGAAASNLTSTSAIDEAIRLTGAFEQAARTHLAVMSLSARAIVRAWAEAEIAIQAARCSGEPNAAELPSAEEFRAAPHLAREEISREVITRWRAPGGQPLGDQDEDRVLYREGRWYLPLMGTDRPAMFLTERGQFERVTYAEYMQRAEAPLLIKSLSVPGILADDMPGWLPDRISTAACAAGVLARLDELMGAPVSNRAERVITHEYVFHHGVSKPNIPTIAISAIL
ncbi:hypothetical protein ASF60_22290 [Methylobacterium sp. Leaf113]|uniref:hypothetical protein n=1 Tax=Methylobacterium sp. Leaf113 TaxID=1736259 RepID=UPI000728C8D5|nr:hypothetical protein [Methylobacterium sp. Leaf113]KQP81761.1 hypothetical protein ASF60_22290 [Methylobacterium sp. Leaf113]